jgi:biotin carboxyl carrier protein
MTFEVEVAGRTRTVTIERTDRASVFTVTIDGRSRVVDVARVGEYGLSLLLDVAAAGPPPGGSPRSVHFCGGNGPENVTIAASRDVQITPGAVRGELLVSLNGRMMTVAVNGRRTGHAAEAAAHGHGEIHITAPMPGRVVRVLVAAGDEVSARQGVVVVEAMKMENELRAPRSGRIKEVGVVPGTSVEAGRILAIIE